MVSTCCSLGAVLWSHTGQARPYHAEDSTKVGLTSGRARNEPRHIHGAAVLWQ